MGNRLRRIRESQGRTLEDVASEAGLYHGTLSRLERGGILKDYQMTALARALGVPTSDIPETEMVPAINYIGAGAEFYPIDDYAKGQGLGEIECPRGLNPATTVAAIVKGASMEPMVFDGWYVFYSREPEQDVYGVVGKLCVVKLADGRMMLKQVRRGPTPGRFNLISINAGLIEDVELEWASPVKHMQAPE
ncbi:MAG: helix-turn-helix transcriptional regulator [Alphaproteobacteria bacterium]|nr:helix-turn-helix transcriptional regulator [Alphaproteobacteria bacterium]